MSGAEPPLDVGGHHGVSEAVTAYSHRRGYVYCTYEPLWLCGPAAYVRPTHGCTREKKARKRIQYMHECPTTARHGAPSIRGAPRRSSKDGITGGTVHHRTVSIGKDNGRAGQTRLAHPDLRLLETLKSPSRQYCGTHRYSTGRVPCSVVSNETDPSTPLCPLHQCRRRRAPEPTQRVQVTNIIRRDRGHVCTTPHLPPLCKW